IQPYNEIRKMSATVPVYLCIRNDAAFSQKELQWHIREIYKIDLEKDTAVYPVIDNIPLLNYLYFNDILTKVFFVKESNLMYRYETKYSKIPSDLPVAEEIKFDKKRHKTVKHKSGFKAEKSKTKEEIAQIALENNGFMNKIATHRLNTGDIVLSTIDVILPVNDDVMYMGTEMKNELIKYSFKEGKITHIYDKPKEGASLFCELIAKVRAACDTAYKFQTDFLEKLNRRSYNINHITYNGTNVILHSGIQAGVILEKDLVIPGAGLKGED